MLSKKAKAMQARRKKAKEPPTKICSACGNVCHSATKHCIECGEAFYTMRLPKGSRTMRWTGGV